ncbi:preprotein translocase subunit YajC [Alkalicoccobacillus murimartini]|uniref:Preprotein translocase subunit YajC n=1 Tax=Alkalicoccobacillus murimartini TaxID=171685 RepID=A0ABT9YC33_9BACI|nr:preprotein translocase subunit YajC [Alkalicoccobacillus murimartini]MDQ0205400.1 preprotein translocase subunit YajC [Alkalicoccobacillus murimartini]
MELAPLLSIVLMIVVFYFFLIRPQQKRQKQVREMHSSLQRGDKIVTIGGLHGTIDAIDEDTVILLVNDNRKLTFDRASVRDIVKD